VKKKKITVSAAKAKGRELQQWTCSMISKITGIPWGPDELIASREGAQNGTDVRLIDKALRLFPFSVECKRQETWAIPNWIQQARSNQLKGTDWLLVVKKSRQPPIVVMDAECFFKLMEKVINNG